MQNKSYRKIVPCLDVYNGRVVKGVNFVNFADAGDPGEYALRYCAQGADEVVFLDISATVEGRKNTIAAIKNVVGSLTVPLAVGGGISAIEDMEKLFNAGVSRVSINTAAIKRPELISEAAKQFGSAAIIVAVDVKKVDGVYMVVTHGGNTITDTVALDWCVRCADLGAGEILLTSMDADGTKDGYDLEITRLVASAINVDITASGGCGKIEDFYEVFARTDARSALAASVFHFNELTVGGVKSYLAGKGISVKL